MGIGFGFSIGPFRAGGSVRGPGGCSPEVIIFLIFVGIFGEVVLGLLGLPLKLFRFVFTLNGSDETWMPLVFLIVFILASNLGILFALPFSTVFALFWKNVPLFFPEMSHLSHAAKQNLYGVNYAEGLAPFKMWLLALGSSLLASLVLGLVVYFFEQEIKMFLKNLVKKWRKL